MDFAETLRAQQQATSTENSDNNYDRPKRDLIRFNKDNDYSFTGRVVPLGDDRMFSAGYRVLGVNYTKNDGTSGFASLRFPINMTGDPAFEDNLKQNDPLYRVVAEILEINRETSKTNPAFKDRDIISITNRYRASLRTQFLVVVVPYNMNAGQMLYNQQTGMPDFHLLQLPQSAYNTLLDSMLNGGYANPTGQPFGQFSYVDANITYPIEFKRNGMAYNLQVRTDRQLEALPANYLDKDENGNYLYLDDPETFAKSAYQSMGGDSEDSFYGFMLKTLQAQLDAYKTNGGNPVGTTIQENNPINNPYANGGNPFNQGQAQQAPNPYSNPNSFTNNQNQGFANPNQGQANFGANPSPMPQTQQAPTPTPQASPAPTPQAPANPVPAQPQTPVNPTPAPAPTPQATNPNPAPQAPTPTPAQPNNSGFTVGDTGNPLDDGNLDDLLKGMGIDPNTNN